MVRSHALALHLHAILTSVILASSAHSLSCAMVLSMASLSSWWSNLSALGLESYKKKHLTILGIYPYHESSIRKHLQNWETEQKPIRSLCCLEQIGTTLQVKRPTVYVWSARRMDEYLFMCVCVYVYVITLPCQIAQFLHYASTWSAHN